MSDFDAIHQVEIRPDEVSATTTLAGAVTNGLALHMGNGVGKDEFAPALSWFTDDGNIDSSERTIGAITCVAAEAFDATNDSGADMACMFTYNAQSHHNVCTYVYYIHTPQHRLWVVIEFLCVVHSAS